jgi:hypothetical protein
LIQAQVDKLGEDIAIDINHIEATIRELKNETSSYKNKREQPTSD